MSARWGWTYILTVDPYEVVTSSSKVTATEEAVQPDAVVVEDAVEVVDVAVAVAVDVVAVVVEEPLPELRIRCYLAGPRPEFSPDV